MKAHKQELPPTNKQLQLSIPLIANLAQIAILSTDPLRISERLRLTSPVAMSEPIPVVLCGASPQIATGVKNGLMPEIEGILFLSQIHDQRLITPSHPRYSHP